MLPHIRCQLLSTGVRLVWSLEYLVLWIKYNLERGHQLRRNIVLETKDGCSPLFIACRYGHYNIAKYLIEVCGADIEQKGYYDASEDHRVHWVSPIWVAAVSGHINIVKLVIEHGANVNSLSDTGSTPLRSVCFLCNDDDSTSEEEIEVPEESIYQQLGEADGDVYMSIVRLLVENGADVSKANHNGGTCLINSIHNYQLTKYMIENGADVNASDHQSKTALHYAIQQGRREVTKLLLSCGADPMLRADFCDDALQLCCLGGHVDIFNHLIETVSYPKGRLADAYKLLGSSVLEIHYDLAMVRELWQQAVKVKDDRSDSYQLAYSMNKLRVCDIRRSVVFGDTTEFNSEQELDALTADEFRIQSLLISERVLGSSHRETIQRILYRGTFHMNSLRPDRCIDLWIYALKLRMRHESIFQFETLFATQAITELFLDLISQKQSPNQRDIHDVLSLLVDQLDECRRLLNWRPVYCLHEEIYDLVLGMIVHLLYALNFTTAKQHDNFLTRQVIKKLIRLDPRTSNGSSLLHVCFAHGVFGGCLQRLPALSESGKSSSMIDLINILIENGLEVDSTNHEGLSALQVLCLTCTHAPDKRNMIRRLVECGAHVDRRPSTPEQAEVIRQTLIESGIDVFRHLKLSCLAARKLADSKIPYDKSTLTKGLKQTILIH